MRDVEQALAALAMEPRAGLVARWRQVYGVAPPKRVSCNLLRLGIAWKLQERAHGGLGAAAKRRLAQLAASVEDREHMTRRPPSRLKPGAHLLRDWHGETHRVLVREDGFEWRNTRYRSLSAVARAITGARWSGPRFFGLTERRETAVEPERPADG